MSTARKILLAVVATVVAAVAALYVAAWLRSGPIEPVAIFAPQDGENHPLVFAHQGGEGLAPSNTMVAFRMAVEAGADVLDADLHMTADGELVLIHDETVDRTSDGTGAVRDLTLAELRQLDFGYQAIAVGDQSHPFRGQGVGIVTVEELFTLFGEPISDGRHLRFGIEIKQTTVEGATKLCALIREHRYEQRVLVSSFSQDNMSAFRDACPSVATSATTGEARQFYIFQFVRLSGLYSPPFDSLQVPEYRGGIHVLTSSFVGAARSWNLPVVPWTINEVEDFERIIDDFDPDGINTNYPQRLVDYLESG